MKFCHTFSFFAVLIATVIVAQDYPENIIVGEIPALEVKCLVCKASIEEMELAISKVDPKKIIDVGGARLDRNGNIMSKNVQYIKSETYLTELMEEVCEKLEDYAKAKYKRNGRLTILKMTLENGGMNPDMSAVDFVQDGDLNKSLKHLCLEILDENEEAILKLFMAEMKLNDIDLKVCTETAKYCNDDVSEETYNDEL